MKFVQTKAIMQKLGIIQCVLLLIATIFFAYTLTLTPANAEDLNIRSDAAAGSELIQVTVLPRHSIITFSTKDLPGSGTNDDPYITDNAGFDVDVELFGEGHLVIRDQDGNILATYDKLSGGNETVTLHIDLPGGVGDYVLTAEFSNLSDHSDIYGTAAIHVRWKPIIGPDVPSTGYYYFAGYAVAQMSFWGITLIFSFAVCFVIFLLRMHSLRHRHAQNTRHKKQAGKKSRS